MKKISAATISVLLVAVMVFFSGCDALLNTSTTEEVTTLPFSTSLTEQPDSEAAVVNYYNYLIERARTEKTGITRNTRYDINDLKIVGRELEGVTNEDGNQQSDPDLAVLNAAAKEVKSFIAKAIKSSKISVDFGEDWDQAAPNTIASPEFAQTAQCVMGEETTSESNRDIVYTNYYYGDMSFKTENYPLAANSILAGIFPYPDEAMIREELAKMSDYIVLNDYSCSFEDNTVSFSSDRLTDQINNANYTSYIHITAHATGVGNLADYGELTVYLTLKCADNYSFNWVNPNEIITNAE